MPVSANAFTLPHTFLRQKPKEVFQDLAKAHFSGIHLALNYHGSRDFLLRQGPQLEYLQDGFHYYLPNLEAYAGNALRPYSMDHLSDNFMLDQVLLAADSFEMNVNAWLVFSHNSSIGRKNPECTITNVFGNHFLSDLCPSNPKVKQYFLGMVRDLVSRGVQGITAESLHFHGSRHGDHHERFFIEMSPTTEFLFSLCFCPSCIANFDEQGGEGEKLKRKVASVLLPFLEEADEWLSNSTLQINLLEVIGPEILQYLACREKTVELIYAEIAKLTSPKSVKISYVDQSPLIDTSSIQPAALSWLFGVDTGALRKHVDTFLPLMYRALTADIRALAMNYKEKVGGEIGSILRPTYPDSVTSSNLIDKVQTLQSIGISNIDFYLLDTWRSRDLQRVAEALERIA